MKKIFALLLSILMITAILPLGVSVVAVDDAVITLSSKTAIPNNNVTVDISIKNNPGILAMAFCVEYDADVFEYVDYTQGYLTDYTITNHSDKGYVSFVSAEDSNVKTNGIILSLNFKVKATAENGDYVFEMKNNNPEKYGNSLHNSFANASEQFIVPSVVNGVITVTDVERISGDVNNDKNIDNKDYALLMQYLNGWDVELKLDNANVNGDDTIDNKDYALLMQYLNGWDVQLK